MRQNLFRGFIAMGVNIYAITKLFFLGNYANSCLFPLILWSTFLKMNSSTFLFQVVILEHVGKFKGGKYFDRVL